LESDHGLIPVREGEPDEWETWAVWWAKNNPPTARELRILSTLKVWSLQASSSC